MFNLMSNFSGSLQCFHITTFHTFFLPFGAQNYQLLNEPNYQLVLPIYAPGHAKKGCTG